jgi:surface polysaccharide O-acyltransferase-like enzyme
LLIPAKSDEPMRVFFKKRFNRVGVPLIFWTAVYFIWNFGVHEIPFTPFNFQQGLLSGSYPILWFLYMLIGLYLVTPILRPLVIHLEHKKFTFLMIIWFVGTISVPLIHTFTAFSYNPLTFVFTDWVGYYLLGIYLQNTKVRSSIVYLAASLGLLVAVLGSWFITALYGEQYTGFFHGYLSFNMITASAALFLILIGIPRTKVESGNGTFNRLLHWIGQNTLPIYLVHIIVLESLHLGLLGFYLPYTHDLLIDVPVVAFVTFVLSSTIIYVLKKIPHVSKLMG